MLLFAQTALEPGGEIASRSASPEPPPAAAQTDPASLRRYITIFVATCSLLGLFLVVVALISFVRRRAVQGLKRGANGEGLDERDSSRLPDAWSEAGRRAAGFDARPFERNDDDEGEEGEPADDDLIDDDGDEDHPHADDTDDADDADDADETDDFDVGPDRTRGPRR